MGLLKDQALRLLRETWASPTELAEEIYAILNSDRPLTVDGPLTVNNPTSSPAVVVNQDGNSDVSFLVRRSVLGDLTLPAAPPLADVPGRETTPSSTPAVVASSGGGGGTLGKVTAGGPGDTYTLSLYGNGPFAAATQAGVSARVPQIDAAATVPADTWVLVVSAGGAFYFQPPVWL